MGESTLADAARITIVAVAGILVLKLVLLKIRVPGLSDAIAAV